MKVNKNYLNFLAKSNLTQTKEGIIRELKTNYSQDKIRRKKNISLNTDYSQLFGDSLAGIGPFMTDTKMSTNMNLGSNGGKSENKLSEGNISKNNFLNNSTSQIKKDQPLKLYNENASTLFTTSNLNNKSLFNSTSNQKLNKQINEIEMKMDKSLKENKTNSKSKKYNIIKHSFEELLKVLSSSNTNNTQNKLIQKLLIGYHEVVTAFSVENRELKENYSKIKFENDRACEEKHELNKLVLFQQKEIEELKNKILLLKEKDSITINENIKPNEILDNIENHQIKNKEVQLKNQNTHKYKSSENEKIINLNKNNLCDLDALYFFDKVEMSPAKSASSKNIPILKLGINLNNNNNNNRNNKITNLINNNNSMLNMMKSKIKY